MLALCFGGLLNQFKINLDHLKFKSSLPKAFQNTFGVIIPYSDLNLNLKFEVAPKGPHNTT
jgi:hypothetical protein